MSQYTKDKEWIAFLQSKRPDIKKNQVYKHFKGGLYIVEDLGIDAISGQEMVVYRHLNTGELYVRPKDNFLGIKKTEEGYIFRFKEHFF